LINMKKNNRILIYPLILIGFVLMLTNSCKKENNNNPTPILTTTAVSDITTTSATCGGNITSDGGTTVTVRGVCWNTGQTPTIADSKTTDGTGAGSFTSAITGLTLNTTYYVRAYATNSAGTGYGSAISFTTIEITFNPNLTYGSVSDNDGNTYKTIPIGTQTWMAENLKTTKYKDGTSIPLVSDNTAWSNLSTPAYCWYNNDAATFKATYGAMYNWYTVNTGKLCPTGWHMPTDAEWTTLTTYLGGESIAGDKLRETGTVHWIASIAVASNESGFTALPGNYRGSNGTFFVTNGGSWWSTTDGSTGNAWARGVNDVASYVIRNDYNKKEGLSVRCLRD
jgi:uncharacterized protein (TIGR02145 family)